MLFPDETNLRHVASALWRNADGLGQASVIVGAGFSKNALPKSNNSQPNNSFPSWAELTDMMVDQLYAHESDESRGWRKSTISGSVSGALRIAEEYEAARGRGQLDSLLKRAIPDLDFVPGTLHHALCELPWVDILTTNYDTLLERSARQQLERRYQTVLSQQDIPTAQQPRIIKLHGSFPDSKQPYIITEEDFRTYESKFPVMVNLAQQCLSEKTCCLIGFSGDDPNFLRWSGWVRDVLGSSHMEPVYLVGLHDHSPSQRSLLDRRHIRTIDLSPLFPTKDWSEPAQRHQAATAWFIEALKSLRPAETSEWPEDATKRYTNLSLPDGHPKLPQNNGMQFRHEWSQPHSVELPADPPAPKAQDNFQELPTVEQLEFQAESVNHFNRRNRGTELDLRIDAIVDVWQANRSLYPGWLVLPWSNHGELTKKTATWASVIPERAVQQGDQLKALKWLTELSWRLEKAISPWSSEMIDCVAQVIKPSQLGSEASKPAIELAHQLLRAFREDGREEEFLTLKEKLSTCPTIPHYGRNFIHQQTVLLHLENWRMKDALDELLLWDISSSDALWKAKRAALLGEFRPDLALGEALSALSSLQNRPESGDLHLRSREAYVLWLSTVLTDWDDPQRQDFHRRRRSIQRNSFDAFNFEERLNEALQSPPKTNVSRDELLSELKPGQTQVTRAYTMRRYIEETAGLVSGPGFSVYANSIKNAVPWMAISDPQEALRLSARYRTSSERDWTFPSYMLAALGRECISQQFEGLKDTLTFLLEEPAATRRFRTFSERPTPKDLINDDVRNSTIRAAVAHGTRLNDVLTQSQICSFVKILLQLRQSSDVFEWQTLNKIDEAVHHTLPTLSQEQLNKLAVDLIQQPVSGNGDSPISLLNNRDITVSTSFRINRDAAVTAHNDHVNITSTIENLLAIQERGETLDIRWNANLRLSFAARQNLLTTESLATYQNALNVQLVEVRDDLYAAMICEAFHPADLLTLDVGNVDERRRMILEIFIAIDWPKFLQRNEEGKVTGIRYLSPSKDPSSLAVELTSEPWASSKLLLNPSDWSEHDVLDYLTKARTWIEEEGAQLVEHEKNRDPRDPLSARGRLTWRFERISRFCNNVALLGHAGSDKVLSAAAKLSIDIDSLLPEYGIKFSPVLIKSGKVDAKETAKRIRELYAKNDTDDKFNALMSVLIWTATYERADISPPPTYLISEFAVTIRTRRAPELGWALDISKILVQRYPELVDASFFEDVFLGLSLLASETSPSNPSSLALAQRASLSDLRVSCLNLLRVMPNGLPRNEVIEQWNSQSTNEVDWKVREALEALLPDG